MSAICIDVSHWQGYPDFAKVKNSGVFGIIHKATEGTSYIDPNRARNCSNALDAGLSICTYHFLKHGSVAAQMKHYLQTIQPQPGERVVIDYEDQACVLSDLHSAVNALLNYQNGLRITIYSGHLLKENLGSARDELLAAYTDLWLAQYTAGNPSWPKGTYPKWALWQYTDKGTVNGVEGYVDLDRFNGSNEQFLKWIDPESKPRPIPEPIPKTHPVTIELTVPDDVEVKIAINGIWQ